MEKTEPQNHGTNQNGTEAVTQHPKKILKKIRKWFKNWRSNWAREDGDVRWRLVPSWGAGGSTCTDADAPPTPQLLPSLPPIPPIRSPLRLCS